MRRYCATIGSLWPALLVFIALSGTGCRRLDTLASAAPSFPRRMLHHLGPVLFKEMARSGGLSYRWAITGPRPINILQGIGAGCAFLDYNGDGNLDVLLVGPDHLALFRGDGHGHFVDVSRRTGLDRLRGHFLGCAVGDYDNDGYPDLYITGFQTGILLHNEASAGLRVYRDVTKKMGLTSQPWGTSAAFADLDGDGYLDLYICNYVRFGALVQPQLCKDGSPMHPVLSACGPTRYEPLKGTLYRNVGGKRFVDVTRSWGLDRHSGRGLGVAFVPDTGAGHAGLALANDTEPGNLFARQGPCLFVDRGVASDTAFGPELRAHGGMGIDWGDYDNDGKLDLFVATFYDEIKCLYHNDGSAVAEPLFTCESRNAGLSTASLNPMTTFGCKFVDVDNDGRLDLVVSNGYVADNADQLAYYIHAGYREPTLLFHNDGGKPTRFTDISPTAGDDLMRPIVGRGLAAGDYDNDGRMDVLVVDGEGAPLLLHNESVPVGQWIGFRLVGSGRSNRDAYGAVVTVVADGRKLMRHCHADGSYLSSSDPRVHFGLGNAKTVDTVTIRWPDDRVTRFSHMTTGKYHTICEP